MSEVIYLAESSVLKGLNPDILPEITENVFRGSGPGVCRRKFAAIGDGTDFEEMIFKGRFKTNDERNDPTNIFITVLRDGPEDGAIAEHFNNGYGVALMPLNDRSAADKRYSLFVVDNSMAIPRVVLENVVHTGWGDMPYLSATSVTLNPNTWYNFEIHFGTHGAFEFFYAQVGSFFGSADITQGAYKPQSNGTYYGVSISYNEGKVWSIDNLALFFKNPQYPVHEFLMDGSIFSDKFIVKAHAYAAGKSSSPVLTYGVTMSVFNYTTKAWVEVDDHDNGPGDGSFLLSSAEYGTLSKADYASPSDRYIRVLVASKYPSAYLDNIESYLHVDFPFVENWDSTSSHAGGMGDAYIKESSVPVKHSFDMYNVGASEWIREINTKITVDLFLPVLFLSKIESIDAMGIVTGLLLDGVDYSIYIDDEYRTFSSDERKKIIFVSGGGFNVRVTYSTFDNIKSIQSYVEDDRRLNYSDELLVFLCSPWEIFAVLDYRGSTPRAEVRTHMVNWIMGSVEDSIDTYDIESELHEMENVSNLRVMSLTVRKHCKDGSSTNVIADSFVLDEPKTQQFFTFDDATHISFTPESD